MKTKLKQLLLTLGDIAIILVMILLAPFILIGSIVATITDLIYQRRHANEIRKYKDCPDVIEIDD